MTLSTSIGPGGRFEDSVPPSSWNSEKIDQLRLQAMQPGLRKWYLADRQIRDFTQAHNLLFPACVMLYIVIGFLTGSSFLLLPLFVGSVLYCVIRAKSPRSQWFPSPAAFISKWRYWCAYGELKVFLERNASILTDEFRIELLGDLHHGTDVFVIVWRARYWSDTSLDAPDLEPMLVLDRDKGRVEPPT